MAPSTSGIVFPRDPFNPRLVDEEFLDEADAVRSLGGEIILVDHTELVAGNFLPRTKIDSAAFYRGWMMSSDTYAFMESGMSTRGVSLKTSSKQYTDAYYLDGWYRHFQHLTPRSVWFPKDDADYRSMVERECGSGPFVVKDPVKSRKHEWETACFAPTLDALPVIVGNFLRLQGDTALPLIVVREFEDFRKDQGEVRVWWVDGEAVLSSPHPDTPMSLPAVPDDFMGTLREAVSSFGSRFVTTDLAQHVDGRWRVMEVSDGQVSGLPKGFDAFDLYVKLLEA